MYAKLFPKFVRMSCKIFAGSKGKFDLVHPGAWRGTHQTASTRLLGAVHEVVGASYNYWKP
jgi:hypothetical protein